MKRAKWGFVALGILAALLLGCSSPSGGVTRNEQETPAVEESDTTSKGKGGGGGSGGSGGSGGGGSSSSSSDSSATETPAAVPQEETPAPSEPEVPSGGFEIQRPW